MGRHQSIETALRSDCFWLIDCTRLCQNSFCCLLFRLTISSVFDIRFFLCQESKDALAWFESDAFQGLIRCNVWESRENVVIQQDQSLTWCLPLILWQGKLKTPWVEGICGSTLWSNVFQAMKGSFLCHQRPLDVDVWWSSWSFQRITGLEDKKCSHLECHGVTRDIYLDMSLLLTTSQDIGHKIHPNSLDTRDWELLQYFEFHTVSKREWMIHQIYRNVSICE